MAKIYDITWTTPFGEFTKEVACDNFNDLPRIIFESIRPQATGCPVEITKIELVPARVSPIESKPEFVH